MLFTSYDYVLFLLVVFLLYWGSGRRTIQNAILLISSYIFYGYIHPWFCILIGTSTVVDYLCGLAMDRYPDRKGLAVTVSVVTNLGMLGTFKYFNFFSDSVHQLLSSVGVSAAPPVLRIILPVGISFYTFQTLSYTVDIYRGQLRPRRNLLDFALFVSFFPQLVAGPIERAKRMLPQIEQPRQWDGDRFVSAWPLLIAGFVKKMVIADNVAVYVDKVYMHQHPSLLMLAGATVAFAVQIYADFSGYTDIARASARLLGFDLAPNFNRPYAAISPSDFWRRWHISFSSWIRDYVYIPLGGSRVSQPSQFLRVLLITMGLAGLWHGADWHFVWWGLYHGLLLFVYHRLGKAGRWKPQGRLSTAVAWSIMSGLTLSGWALFRAPSMGWLLKVLLETPTLGLTAPSLAVVLYILAMTGLYSLPLWMLRFAERLGRKVPVASSVVYAAVIVIFTIFACGQGQDFIYFQF